MKLTESQLKSLIRNEVVKKIKNTMLNEAFDNPETRQVISKHGGLDNDKYGKFSRSRKNVPLDKVNASEKNVISQDLWMELPYDVRDFLENYTLEMNDGSMLFIGGDNVDDEDMDDYNDKLDQRKVNYDQDRFIGDQIGSDMPSGDYGKEQDKTPQGRAENREMADYVKKQPINPDMRSTWRSVRVDKRNGF